MSRIPSGSLFLRLAPVTPVKNLSPKGRIRLKGEKKKRRKRGEADTVRSEKDLGLTHAHTNNTRCAVIPFYQSHWQPASSVRSGTQGASTKEEKNKWNMAHQRKRIEIADSEYHMYSWVLQ